MLRAVAWAPPSATTKPLEVTDAVEAMHLGAAEYIEKYFRKPVAGFIAGTTAPKGKRMGHAGAVISGGKGTAEAKIQALTKAGVKIAPTPSDMGKTLKSML